MGAFVYSNYKACTILQLTSLSAHINLRCLFTPSKQVNVNMSYVYVLRREYGCEVYRACIFPYHTIPVVHYTAVSGITDNTMLHYLKLNKFGMLVSEE